MQMVFQNPDSTLNPSHTVGYAIGRALRRLRGLSGSAAAEVARLLDIVKLPREFAVRKPDQLSGGQKQRVAIARALAGDPEVVVADEPVSALDVSVQAAVINLLIEIQAERGATLVFISHDLSVVRYLADHVAVMYLGTVVEVGARRRRLHAALPPVHRGPAIGRAGARSRCAGRAHHPRRHAAERDRGPARLPVQHPLSAPDRRDLRRDATARAANRDGPSHRLPHPRWRSWCACRALASGRMGRQRARDGPPPPSLDQPPNAAVHLRRAERRRGSVVRRQAQ